MIAHTPGPWRYWKCSGGSPDADYVHIAAGGLDVADVRINSVTEDDLRLMVAAPLLLDALKRMMAMNCPLTGNPSHQTLVEFWEYEKTQGRGEADDQLFALSAIFRATGK